MQRRAILASMFLLFLVGMARPVAYAFESIPAIWHQGLSISRLVGYEKGEYLVVSDIWTGTPGRDAVVRHSLEVKVDLPGRAFTATQAATAKTPKETLTVTLIGTENPKELAAHFEHTVGEGNNVQLQFSGITRLVNLDTADAPTTRPTPASGVRENAGNGNRRGRNIAAGYFTVDDGATWFADSLDQIPPFTKDGKEAVRAYIFRCGKGKPFVAYLERYRPEAKKLIEEARMKARQNPEAPPDPALHAKLMGGGVEVKKPNDPSPWVQQRDFQRYSQVVQIKAPAGESIEELEPVLP